MYIYKQLLALRPIIVQQVQELLDSWEQEEDDSFGICDEVSNIISSVVLDKLDLEVIDGGQEGDDHAYPIFFDPKSMKAWIVDIPPNVYETGGGYSWKKIDQVELSPEDIIIDQIDDPVLVRGFMDENGILEDKSAYLYMKHFVERFKP